MTSYVKIKNFATSTSSPFTLGEIAREFDMSPYVVRKHFKQILKEGLAIQIGTAKNPKWYISKKYQGNTESIVANYNKIKNYIYYLSMPFTAKKISSELGMGYCAVCRYIPDILKEGYIKLIGMDKGTKVYILNRHNGKNNK